MGKSRSFSLNWLILIIVLVFQFSFTNALQDEYITLMARNDTTICEVTQTWNYSSSPFFLKCMTQFLPDQSTYCRKEDSGRVKSLMTHSFNKAINLKVTCVSNLPIFVKVVTSTDVAVKEELLNLKWHRIVTDFKNSSTYNYQLQIRLSMMEIHAIRRVVVMKYTVFTKEFPKNNIHILWIPPKHFLRSFYLGGWNNITFDELEKYFNFVDPEIIDVPDGIIATDEVVTVPCVNVDPENTILKRGNNSEVSMDNSSIWYSQAIGFKINTTVFTNWNSTFICRHYRFPIAGPPDSSWEIKLTHLVTTPPTLKTPFFLPGGSAATLLSQDNKANQNMQLTFTCTSTTDNVTILVTPGWDHPMLNVELNSSLDVTYTYKEKPQKLYIATANVNISWSFRELIKSRHQPEIKIKDELVRCVDASTKKIIFEWNPQMGAFYIGTTPMSPGKILFDFPLLQIEFPNLECYGIERQLDFRQIECNNRFSCMELARGVFFKSERKLDDKVTKVMNGTDCYPFKDGCKSLPILNKGFFFCQTTRYGGHKSHDLLSYQDFYFVGFDRKLYLGNVNPPDSAIIKMEIISQTDNYLAVPGNVTLSCEANSLHFENGIQWLFVFGNESEIQAPYENITDVVTENEDRSNPRRNSIFQLGDSSVKQIKCAAPLLSILNDGNDNHLKWKFSSLKLTLENSYAPIIKISDHLKMKYFRVGETNQFLKCQVDSIPTSEIVWTFRGREPESPYVIISSPNNKLLQFTAYNESFEGKYLCTATNKMGTTSQTFRVQTFNEDFSLWRIFAIVISILFLLAFPAVAIILRRLRQRIKDLLTEEEIREFMEGISSSGNDNLAFSKPYNISYELLPHQFEIDMKKELGKGAFGVVYLGTVLTENFSGNAAFKTFRKNSGSEKLKSLLSELKIMIYIGDHENIIRLVGAYTKELNNGSVFIATELCSLGSLESYLRDNDTQLNDYNETDNVKNESIKAHSLAKILSNKQFCNWSSQIANGMEYLALKHIVHSDLATRNILLNSDGIAKITDFGLSRQMYNCYNYVKKGRNDPLPWKWMALESLRTFTFSTQSDIWAYGITLWEIFSLGAVPYPGISWTPEFLEMLDNGLRNPKPKRADLQIYSVMLSCWNKKPRERPSFFDLKVFFMKLINDVDRTTIEGTEDETEVEEAKYTLLQ